MARKIEKILLDNFRGATTPIPFEFDSSKKIVIIFGDSGTGKSTVVDAIDFVCNQSFGCLDQKSVGNKKAELLVSLNSTPNRLKVVLEGDGKTWQSVLSKGKPQTTGTDQILSVQVLRRSDILKFIDGQPKERYERLKPFISMPNSEKSEYSLRAAIKNDEASQEEAVRAIEQASSALEELWKSEDSPDTDFITWARRQAGQDIDSAKTAITALNQVVEEINRISNITESVNTFNSSLEGLRSSLQNLETKKNSLQTKPNLHLLVETLQASKKYLVTPDLPDACPVCQQPTNLVKLSEGIDKRLSELIVLSGVMAEIETSKSNLMIKEKELEREMQTFISGVCSIAEKCKGLSADEKENIGLTKIDVVETYPDAKKAYDSVSAIITKIKERVLSFGNVSLIEAIKIQLKIVNETTQGAELIASRLSVLKELLDIVEGSRKEYIDSILGNIAADIERLYILLHPCEGLGGIRFSIDPDKVGSLDLCGQFQGAGNILPQAYYSEAHLDTLGICIFLALAKYYKTEVLVLDDVVNSADEVHMKRYIDMLHDESSNFNQIIVTTHYRPLRDRYRFNRAPAGLAQLFDLKPWALSRGIQHSRSTIWVDGLLHYIQPQYFDRQIVASKAGILLECLLDDLTLRYKCHLPRQAEPFYNLGDLLNSLTKKMRQALRMEVMDGLNVIQTIQLEDIIERIDSYDWIRNQVGCHFNTTGLLIGDQDVTNFGNAVVELATALICPECGSLPNNDRSGSYWECQCKKRRLHPLEIPF